LDIPYRRLFVVYSDEIRRVRNRNGNDDDDDGDEESEVNPQTNMIHQFFYQ
jgi:hypothetical protein